VKVGEIAVWLVFSAVWSAFCHYMPSSSASLGLLWITCVTCFATKKWLRVFAGGAFVAQFIVIFILLARVGP
jgi:hypothetical protein